jgi:hypothetical protein
MSQINDIRVETTESQTSLKSSDLSETLKELDSRILDAHTWSTITYTTNLISKIEYFSDAAKSVKTIQREFSRTVGLNGINYISGIVTTTYNDDGSTDSTITTTITRTSDKIVGCASVFYTAETPC